MLAALEKIQQDFNKSGGKKKVSLADLIVLGGCAAVEEAARKAGHRVTVPFAPGRTDASQEQTDVNTFDVLEPVGDGFRNYLRADDPLSPETRLLDRANLLRLTAPEMTVLVGGMRALGANHGQSKHGVFTDRPGDADERLLRQPARHRHGVEAVGLGRRTSTRAPTARPARPSGRPPPPTSCSARTRSCARWPRSTRATTPKEKFVRDFVAAWNKVMNLDRYDLLAAARDGRPRAAVR